MQINNVKNYKSVVYPKSFYEKLKAEQVQFKGKISARPKDVNNCLIEEVDCERSILSLNNAETVFKKIGKPVRQRIKVTEKQPDKGGGNKKTAKTGAEKKIIEYKAASINTLRREIVELDTIEKEKCVIKELDCKQSLVNIGYDDVQEEEETELLSEIDIEPDKEVTVPAENMQEEIQEEMQAVKQEVMQAEMQTVMQDEMQTVMQAEAELNAHAQTADSGLAENGDKEEYKKEDKEPEYDIHRYDSSSIVGTIVLYPEDKEDVENLPAEDFSTELIYEDEVYAEDNKAGQKIILFKNGMGIPAFWSGLQKNGRLFIQEVSTNFLHSEAIHTKNKLGFISLLALFGLLGIFTENRACLGFWAFLYYTRYFYVKPDKVLYDHVLKSAAFGFAAGIALSFLAVILEALFGTVSFLIYGMGAGMVISVLVFTGVLYALQFRINREGHESTASDTTEGSKQDTVIAMEQISSDMPADGEEEISS